MSYRDKYTIIKQNTKIFLFIFSFLFSQSYNDVKLFYKNGLPKEIHHYRENNNKVKLAHKTFYFDNGQKERKETTLYGLKDGQYTEWRRDGTRKIEGMYENGDKHGLWVQWGKNGRKLKEGMFHRGNKKGSWTKYTENGHKLWEKDYLEGEQIDMRYLVKNIFEK